MKKITLMWVVLLAFCWQSYAQFTENFDASTDLPTGWTIINQGGSNEWTIYNQGADAHSGTNIARIQYNTVAHDDYLITPAINVTAQTNDRISFYIKSINSGYLEPYEVLLSTTTNTTDTDFSVVLQAEQIASATWSKKEFNLAPYIGQTVYIAIRATGTDEDRLGVDDFVNDANPTCPQPTALTATNIAPTTATLSWTENGTASLYNVEVIASGATPTGVATDSGVTNAFNKIGLNAATAYDFYVQADCGSGDLSAWSGPFTFTTACDAIGSFTEGFESYATSVNPDCWSFNLGGSSGYAYTSSTEPYAGVRALRSGNSGSATATHYLVSPLLSDMPSGTYRLKMYAKGSTSNTVTVGRISDPNDPSTFTAVTTLPVNTEYVLYAVNFDTPSTAGYFAIKVDYTSTYNYISIDDVIWEPIPSCIEPSTLTADNITAAAAELGWTENGTATLWNIEWGTVGFTPGSGTMVTGATANPYLLSGLASETNYEFYVQADCGGGDTSSWTGPFSFTTLISCPKPTALTATNVTPTTAELGWTENGTATQWNIEWGTTGFTQGTGTMITGTTTNPNPLPGLTAATSYSFYVQTDCGGGDTSTWAGPFTFVTSCLAVDSFSENFDGVATPALPTCWSKVLDNGVSTYASVSTSDSADYSAPNGVALYNSSSPSDSNIMLVSPVLSNLSAGTNQLRLFARATEDTQDIEVGTITNPTDGSTFTALETVNLTTTHTEYTIPFTSYTGTDTYIAIRRLSTSTYTYVYLDDITWEVTPTCVAPATGSLTATNITSTSADLGWTESGSATVWDIELGLAGFTPTGTPTELGVTANPYAATLLTANTSYDFYVRASCGSGDASDWRGPFTFYTGHCIPTGTSADTYIDIFTTTNGGVNIDNSGSGFSTGNYGNMYNTMSVSQGPNGTVDFNVEIISGTVGCAIWIDWNNDLVFDTTEAVYSTTSYGDGPFTGTITVPSGTADGDYRMRVMIDYNDLNPGDDNACSFTSGRGEVEDYKFTVDATLSAKSFDSSNFVAYPNPVKDVLNLSYTSAISSVKVMNLLGQEVMTKKVGNTSTQIDMSGLTAGAYIVTITVDDIVKSIKVIKQ